ncbi:DUF2567 domain-containing protein [Mycobacterium xenopi]|uniref:Membrane protein n=1 Tax=Mycobacterium xenopi TaxID=1789 RepID=A0AAD1M1E1_MYCXE|nr:DUF2567 domain-containing protein [Mycobacterium xenopi]MDA3637941.1 DUF2567 domain-containing protein [Mycobacterium xenopi]MDA3656010.1 DUF2567 domain-containing protein [Mycobacterium xenopi]MDA3660672.1 DUF2567 domain-containing protein [Mycobacterium xenopi]ORX09390.1 hypothetical protein AWC32_18540 [Mycobacterium xenopi]SPX88644.1 Protein of uncharacterised function (DUF2567) [Mycobacterium xenopi]
MSEPRSGDAPRASRRRAIAVVVAGLVAAGVVIGALWAWIAPPIHGVVALTHEGERVHDYLGNEADHFFVAAFLMLGLLTVVAVVASVLVWEWRAHRGPAMVVALSVGMVGAAAAATPLGALLVRARYGVVDIAAAPLTPEHRVHYFTEAPPVFFGPGPLQIGCTLLLPAATTALVYAFLVAAAVRDDLGGYPAVESPQAPTAVTVSPGGGSR